MTDPKTPGVGNVEITLEGKKYTMTPCFRAFSAINREIPGGIIQAITTVSSYDINAMEAVIAHGVGFEDIARRTLGEKIFKAGTKNLAAAVIQYLVNLNNGGVPPDVEQDAAVDTENPTTQTT